MQLPHIDLTSFLLGFLVASLFWWVFNRARSALPQLQSELKKRAETARQRSLEGVSVYIREDVIRRAQRTHLAHHLFPLDDILVAPRLLAPPSFVLSTPGPAASEGVASQVVPYLPDWPELAAQYGVHKLSAAQAMQNGMNIAIIGQPGSGKTTALADLACQVARREDSTGPLARLLPVFLHGLDFDFSAAAAEDPADMLIKLVTSHVPVLVAPRIPRYMREMLSDGSVLLLIDGLDEMTPAEVETLASYLKTLFTRYPRQRMAVTASLEYIDGLSGLGVFPFAMACWNASELEQYISQWGELWSTRISPEIGKRTELEASDPLLVGRWLLNDARYLTPLEWTLKAWAVYAGDLRGSGTPAAVQSYVERLNQRCVPLEALNNLGWKLYAENRTNLHFEPVEKFFSAYESSVDTSVLQAELAEPQPKGRRAEKTKGQKAQKISSGARAAQALRSSGLLVEHPSGLVRFSHPVIAGYLASYAAVSEELRPIEHPHPDAHTALFHYLAAQNKPAPWLAEILKQQDTPLYLNLLMVARWLRDAPAAAEWRTPTFRKLVSLFQNESLPTGVRARFIAAFVASNDANAALLFKQLLASPSASIRQMAALAYGALQEQKAIHDLLELFTDQVPDVRCAACLAMGAIDSRTAFNAVADTLLSPEEDLQQAAAEMLARSADGQEILRAAIQEDNLVTRRAAIFGLALIREDWVKTILERITIEDGQWVIRTAAGQALEMLRSPMAYLPRPLPETHQAPWLVTFASKQGSGISPGQPVTELLLLALKTGSPEERISALHYLRDNQDEGVIASIYETMYGGYGPIQEAALFAIWYLSISGAKLPSPTMFGL